MHLSAPAQSALVVQSGRPSQKLWIMQKQSSSTVVRQKQAGPLGHGNSEQFTQHCGQS